MLTDRIKAMLLAGCGIVVALCMTTLLADGTPEPPVPFAENGVSQVGDAPDVTVPTPAP
jgi:hypothetical protein